MNKDFLQPARQFFQWWGDQLTELIPTTIKTGLGGGSCVVEAAINREGWSFSEKCDKRRDANQLNLSAREENSEEQIGEWINRFTNQPDLLKLRLSDDQFLMRDITLPAVAEESLDETLGFQIERITPFKYEDILCYYGVRERDRSKKQIKVWIAAIPKKTLNSLLSSFEHLSPQLLPVNTPLFPKENGGFDLTYQLNNGKNKGKWKPRIALTLLLLNLFGLAAYGALHIHNRNLENDGLRQQLKEVKQKAMTAMDIAQKIEDNKTKSAFITNISSKSPLKVALIEDLTQKIPDHTWLKLLEIKEDKLTVTGYSDNSAELIEQLEKSPYLINVGFSSTVIRDRISGKERFSLSAKLVNKENKPFSKVATKENKNGSADRN